MCQGDSIYDLVDSRDHAAVQAELASGPPLSANFPEERVFICRLNLTRAAAKRQLQYHKVWATPNPAHMNLQFILLQGRYIHPAEYYQNLQESGGQQVTGLLTLNLLCRPSRCLPHTANHWLTLRMRKLWPVEIQLSLALSIIWTCDSKKLTICVPTILAIALRNSRALVGTVLYTPLMFTTLRLNTDCVSFICLLSKCIISFFALS